MVLGLKSKRIINLQNVKLLPQTPISSRTPFLKKLHLFKNHGELATHIHKKKEVNLILNVIQRWLFW